MQTRSLLSIAIVGIAIVIVATALVFLDTAPKAPVPDRLYQVSTIDALLQGVYDGTVTIGDLAKQGDHGTGTFDRLDGELTMIDGVVWQARADGTVVRASPDQTTPFAGVARFRPDRNGALPAFDNFSMMEEALEQYTGSPNLFYMARVDGTFDYVRVRAAPAQTKPYPRLVDALAQQGIYDLRDVEGSIVGTCTPGYVDGVAIPGWHLHFITNDRTRGGHILDISTSGTTTASVDELDSFTVDLPAGTDFTKTNLSQNLSSDLRIVEKGR
jgi:acetolactate decarboxylase